MEILNHPFFNRKLTINIGGKLLSNDKPLIMAILNVTPDSFYDGDDKLTEEKIENRLNEYINEGADIIDVGGYSSRPGAEDISIEEEKKRLSLALNRIIKLGIKTALSIDTCRSDVVDWACNNYNIAMVNDFSGTGNDTNLIKIAAQHNLPYILMHTKGTPKTMLSITKYDNLIKEMIQFFANKINQLREAGIKDIILDPGFGFAKNIEQNFYLLNKLEVFQMFELPLLVGISRKSMIYKTLKSKPNDALNGTTALHMLALQNGANILRVHDVKEARETIILHQLYKNI